MLVASLQYIHVCLKAEFKNHTLCYLHLTKFKHIVVILAANVIGLLYYYYKKQQTTCIR